MRFRTTSRSHRPPSQNNRHTNGPRRWHPDRAEPDSGIHASVAHLTIHGAPGPHPMPARLGRRVPTHAHRLSVRSPHRRPGVPRSWASDRPPVPVSSWGRSPPISCSSRPFLGQPTSATRKVYDVLSNIVMSRSTRACPTPSDRRIDTDQPEIARFGGAGAVRIAPRPILVSRTGLARLQVDHERGL